MTPLRAQMIRDMQLQRLAPRTQEAYIAAVAGLAKFYCRPPDQPVRTRSAHTDTIYSSNAAWRGVPAIRWPVGSSSSLLRPSAGMHSTSTCPHVRDGGPCRTS